MGAASMTEETFYTIREIADVLRINPRTVRKMIAEGQIEAIKVRDEYRIRQSALNAFIRKGRKLQNEENQEAE